MERRNMSELHNWLSTQHHGLRTYRSLKQKLTRLAHTDAEHMALYKLLASMGDPYIDSFDEQPLPVDVADKVFGRVLDIVRDAEESIPLAPADQVQALNKIAAVKLI